MGPKKSTKRTLRSGEIEPDKRPKRVLQTKTVGDSVGLSRQEEQELNKALYASLNETRRSKSLPSLCNLDSADFTVRTASHHGGGRGKEKLPSSTSGNKITLGKKRSLRGGVPLPKRLFRSDSTGSSENDNLNVDEESSKDSVKSSSSSANGSKRKIHAQRKFAQGCSLPGTPTCSPTKASATPVKLLSRTPKTEDFLTFLCLRGSPALPPHLDFFNFSKEELPLRDDSPKLTSSGSKRRLHEACLDEVSSSSANDDAAEKPPSAEKSKVSSASRRSAARASAGTSETARGIVSLRRDLQRKGSSVGALTPVSSSPASTYRSQSLQKGSGSRGRRHSITTTIAVLKSARKNLLGKLTSVARQSEKSAAAAVTKSSTLPSVAKSGRGGFLKHRQPLSKRIGGGRSVRRVLRVRKGKGSSKVDSDNEDVGDDDDVGEEDESDEVEGDDGSREMRRSERSGVGRGSSSSSRGRNLKRKGSKKGKKPLRRRRASQRLKLLLQSPNSRRRRLISEDEDDDYSPEHRLKATKRDSGSHEKGSGKVIATVSTSKTGSGSNSSSSPTQSHVSASKRQNQNDVRDSSKRKKVSQQTKPRKPFKVRPPERVRTRGYSSMLASKLALKKATRSKGSDRDRKGDKIIIDVKDESEGKMWEAGKGLLQTVATSGDTQSNSSSSSSSNSIISSGSSKNRNSSNGGSSGGAGSSSSSSGGGGVQSVAKSSEQQHSVKDRSKKHPATTAHQQPQGQPSSLSSVVTAREDNKRLKEIISSTTTSAGTNNNSKQQQALSPTDSTIHGHVIRDTRGGKQSSGASASTTRGGAPTSTPSPKSTQARKVKSSNSTSRPSSAASSTSSSSSPSVFSSRVSATSLSSSLPSSSSSSSNSIPTFRPSESEFSDPLAYLKKIQAEAEPYGMCKVIPPPSWKLDSSRVNEDIRFTPQVQYIHRLHNRWGPNVQRTAAINYHLLSELSANTGAPQIGGVEIDLPQLYELVEEAGGLSKMADKRQWASVADAMNIPKQAMDRTMRLYDIYCRHILPYATLSQTERYDLEEEVKAIHELQTLEDDAIVRGKSMAVSNFCKISRNVQAMWFKEDPTPDQVESDYWRVVEDRERHVAVQCGHINTLTQASGFPTRKDSPYSRHPWNLNMIPNHDTSVLKYLGPVAGTTIPTMHLGMLFSTSCWSTDPHGLPYIQYHHSGADIIWYSIPKSQRSKFRSAVMETVSTLISSKPRWLKEDCIMVNPSLLRERGVKVSSCTHGPREFVVVFPGTYTATITCGFSVSESVHYATTKWLPAGIDTAAALTKSGEKELFAMSSLLCRLAQDKDVDLATLTEALPLLSSIIYKELDLRTQLHAAGLRSDKKMMNADSPLTGQSGSMSSGSSTSNKKRQAMTEEEKTCEICSRICHLSMVYVEQEEQVLCLEHGLKHIQRRRSPKATRLFVLFNQPELESILKGAKDRLVTLSSPKSTA